MIIIWLVFCETKKLADHLEEFLYDNGFNSASIHGNIIIIIILIIIVK
jgi:superfamily II DNA/RNA helicase